MGALDSHQQNGESSTDLQMHKHLPSVTTGILHRVKMVCNVIFCFLDVTLMQAAKVFEIGKVISLPSYLKALVLRDD